MYPSKKIKVTHPKPAQAKPPKPTANVKQIVVPVGVNKYAAHNMKTVWAINAPQLNIFLTCVVVKIPFNWNQSAKYPANCNIIDIARYGTADINPVFSSSKCRISTFK